MRYFATVLILCSSMHVFAQDWALFPYGQRSIYSQINGRVEVLEIDSVKGSTWYFNSKAPASVSQDTFDLIKRSFDSDVWYDSISVSGDTSYWHTPYGDVPFYNLAKKDEIYLFNDDWYFECTDLDTQMVFGVLDSVRDFMFFNTNITTGGPLVLVFSISKNHGLLYFTHPMYFFENVYGDYVSENVFNLKGLTKDGIRKGIKLAEWSNFALLKPADRLTYHSYWGSNDLNYYQHFILSTERSDSVFTYTYHPRSLHENGEIGLNGIRSLTFNEVGITPKLSARSQTPISISSDSLYEAGLVSFSFVKTREVWSESDSVLHTLISYDSYNKVPYSIIESGGSVDIDRSYVLNTTVGHQVTVDYLSLPSRVIRLVGIQTTDTIWGVDIFTQLPDLHSNNAIHVFPNPTTSVITISGTGPESFHWEVMDVMGRRVMEGQQTNPAIDVSGLSQGTYMLVIDELGQTLFQKE